MTASPRILPFTVLLLFVLPCRAAKPEMVFTRQRFDEMDRAIDSHRDIAHAPVDAFAWGESYMMRGYIEMYLATGDREYLRRLVRVADQILTTRDDRRPGAGKSTVPVWSVDGVYTVATLTLKDTGGKDCLLLRSIRYAYNDQTVVEVQPGEQPGTFTLTTANEYWRKCGKANARFENLSLDPSSPRYFEKVVNDPPYLPDESFQRGEGIEEEPSFLLVATDLRRDKSAKTDLAPVSATSLTSQTIPYFGYIGPIYSAMTRFAKLVKDQPELRQEFGAAARNYIREAKKSVAAWGICWRTGPKEGEGYYLLDPKGAPFWCDGIAAPFNYLGSVGQVLLNLWDCAEDRKALDHARRIAALFKRSCALTSKGGYEFGYWPPMAAGGWKKSQHLSLNTPEYPQNPVADDLSHAAWEVEFCFMCYERGIVFTREDMHRFAATFTEQLWTEDPGSLARRVDGSGGPAGDDSLAGSRWLDLCAIKPRIFELTRTLWESNGWDQGAYGHLTGCYARMFRWQQKLAGKSAEGSR